MGKNSGLGIQLGRICVVLLALLGIATRDMPEHETPPDAIDPARTPNARSAASVRRAEAEAHVGRPAEQWTVADIDTLRQWWHDQLAVTTARDREHLPGPPGATGGYR